MKRHRKPTTLLLNPKDESEFFSCYDGGDEGLMPGERYVILQSNVCWAGWKHGNTNDYKAKRVAFIKKLRRMANWLNRAADWLEQE